MRVSWINLGAMLASLICLAVPASAEQRLYRETPEGWFIYVEDRSCVAYVDYKHGETGELMIRLSARTDENRMHVTLVSDEWERLTRLIGASAMVALEFPSKQNYASVGMVIRNPDSRMGLSASGFGIDEIEKQFATNDTMRVRASVRNSPMETVAELRLRDSYVAMMHLSQCTEEHFSKTASKRFQ